MPAKKKTESKSGAKRRRRSKQNSYATYIHRVQKQVHPDASMSNKAMTSVDAITQDLLGRIVDEAAKLATYNNKETIDSRDIQTAVRLIFPGELRKHAVNEGTKAVTKYHQSK